MHHTPLQQHHHLMQLASSGLRALQELKGAGDIQAFGAGINHLGSMSAFMVRGKGRRAHGAAQSSPPPRQDELDLDYFLVSQVYSLLHHGDTERFGTPTTHCNSGLGTAVPAVPGGALTELERAHERGMGIIAATCFNAGILVTGAVRRAVQARRSPH